MPRHCEAAKRLAAAIQFFSGSPRANTPCARDDEVSSYNNFIKIRGKNV
jgi:hypothetical protein